jgi:hypothetical protein
MTIRRHIFALTLAGFVGIPTLAMARTPMGRHVTGIVQKTNIQAREAEILRTDTGVTLSFVWNNRTKFVANMHFVSTAILQPGNKVEVIYHRPFFGRPFVTKVTLLTTSDGATQTRTSPTSARQAMSRTGCPAPKPTK